MTQINDDTTRHETFVTGGDRRTEPLGTDQEVNDMRAAIITSPNPGDTSAMSTFQNGGHSSDYVRQLYSQVLDGMIRRGEVVNALTGKPAHIGDPLSLASSLRTISSQKGALNRLNSRPDPLPSFLTPGTLPDPPAIRILVDGRALPSHIRARVGEPPTSTAFRWTRIRASFEVRGRLYPVYVLTRDIPDSLSDPGHQVTIVAANSLSSTSRNTSRAHPTRPARQSRGVNASNHPPLVRRSLPSSAFQPPSQHRGGVSFDRFVQGLIVPAVRSRALREGLPRGQTITFYLSCAVNEDGRISMESLTAHDPTGRGRFESVVRQVFEQLDGRRLPPNTAQILGAQELFVRVDTP